MKERIGVYICHCGGNISDYVDVKELSRLMKEEKDIVISKDIMFACADSSQNEMIKDIREHQLDAIVVASCSPKLHLHTFRNVAKRAGINPYNYVQVNIREQCSWAHSDKPEDATYKAVGLIRAGIKRVAHSEALMDLEIKSKKAAVVVGAGVAGMRAALDLARLGNEVYLIEKQPTAGGQILNHASLFPSGKHAKDIVNEMLAEINSMGNITLFTNASIEKVSGNLGNFNLIIQKNNESIPIAAGAILVATGFESYHPKENEFGYHIIPNVTTLPEFIRLIDSYETVLSNGKKQLSTVAFIYCVGNRQTKGENKYCSRVCCSSAIQTSLKLKEKFGNIKTFHFYRDIRTYGKHEMLFEKSLKQGDIYIKYDEKEPPLLQQNNGQINISVKDYLTLKKEIKVNADMVVLVTGMVPRADSNQIAEKFKIPTGNDKFFNEIHPKLKPVETVIKGVFIGGCCQGPKNISESVQSSLSAVAKINALIKKGSIFLDPVIARINADICVWCGKCATVCDYSAIKEVAAAGKSLASVNEASCTGCGICAPVCPVDAIQIAQYTNNEIESMIDGFMDEITLKEKSTEISPEKEEMEVRMKEYPAIWNNIIETLKNQPKTIPEIAAALAEDHSLIMAHMMTMNKYSIVAAAGLDKKEQYYYYKLNH